ADIGQGPISIAQQLDEPGLDGAIVVRAFGGTTVRQALSHEIAGVPPELRLRGLPPAAAEVIELAEPDLSTLLESGGQQAGRDLRLEVVERGDVRVIVPGPGMLRPYD